MSTYIKKKGLIVYTNEKYGNRTIVFSLTKLAYLARDFVNHTADILLPKKEQARLNELFGKQFKKRKHA